MKTDYTIRTIVIHYCHLVGRDYAVNLSYCWLSLLTSTTVVVYVVISMCSKVRHEAKQRSNRSFTRSALTRYS